jgi:hypothetical protein
MVLPGLICAAASWQLLVVLRGLLDTWQAVQVDILDIGAPVEFDFVNLLSLENLLVLVTRLDDQRLVVALLVLVASVLVGGLLVALVILLVGWVYNLLAMMSGGLELELAESGRSSP